MNPAFDPYDVAGGIAADELGCEMRTREEWQQVIRAAETAAYHNDVDIDSDRLEFEFDEPLVTWTWSMAVHSFDRIELAKALRAAADAIEKAGAA